MERFTSVQLGDDNGISDEHERGLLPLAHERLRSVAPPVAKAWVDGVHSGAAGVIGVARTL